MALLKQAFDVGLASPHRNCVPKNIDDLVAQVTDDSLRKKLESEIKTVFEDQLDFGLVFEKYKPESVELPNMKISKDSIVRKRMFTTVGRSEQQERNDLLFRVLSVNNQQDDTGALVPTARIFPRSKPKSKPKSKSSQSATEEQVEESIAVSGLVAVAEFGTPVYPGLKHTGSAVHAQLTAAKNKPSHVVIKGENFHVLQALKFTHENSVDCIYIDPPYNTGGEFIYNDRRVAKEDLFRHSKWVSFMHRRLELAKDLLKDTGVIIVAIDDTEHAHLRMLMDKVFGEQNFISNVVWQGGLKNDSRYVSNGVDYMLVYAKNETAQSSRNAKWREKKFGVDEILLAGQVSWAEGMFAALCEQPLEDELNGESWQSFYESHQRLSTRKYFGVSKVEFVEVYLNARPEVDSDKFMMRASCLATDLMKTWWKCQDPSSAILASKHYTFIDDQTGRPGSVYFRGDLSAPDKPETRSHHQFIHPQTGCPVKVPAGGWRHSDSTMREHIASGRIYFGTTHKRVPQFKRYLDEVDSQVVASTFEKDRRASSKLLTAVLGERRFDFPKDTDILARWIGLVTSQNPDAVVLDFFGGSGSTLHAVMEMNAADGGQRQCILVTNNEVESKQATALTKAGFVPGDPEWEACGVLERVTRPRISTVVTGIRAHLDDSVYSAGLPSERVEFFDLTHEDPGLVRNAYKAIEPLLWLRAGAVGSYEFTNGGTANPVVISSSYAVLHDVNYCADFMAKVNADPTITHVFVVTNSASTFRIIIKSLNDNTVKTMRLYEHYTKTFETNTN